jgi:hypothetical protein
MKHGGMTLCGAGVVRILVGLVFFAVALLEVRALELIDRKSIDRSSISSLGRQLLKEDKEALVGRSANFILVAPTKKEIRTMADEAEFARDYMYKLFPGPDHPVDPALLFLVNRGDLWKKAVNRHKLREDGLAMQLGRELYFKDDSTQRQRPDRIAHEMVHLRLAELHPQRVPLWLEEGLAGYYGWLCSVSYHGRNDVALMRSQPPLDEASLLSLDDLLAVKSYPADAERARTFYRQSEDLVGALALILEREQIPVFVSAMANPLEGETPRELFRRAAGLDNESEVKVIAEMRQRCLSWRKP